LDKIILNGITWSHSRGYTPLMAASQRFTELHPQIEIIWKKRTLQQFADFPLEKLAGQYDLLIIDHPWAGCAAATNTVLPLDKYLSKEYLDDQLQNSAGQSHLSYYYQGHQWALAIDAAAPVASYRADLLKQNKMEIPEKWEDIIVLAKKNKVAVPGIPVDLLMNFYMFCLAHGEEVFLTDENVTGKHTGQLALETMKELWSVIDRKMFNCNPIAIAELMTTTDDYCYCPFAYGYSNYARMGYAKNILQYTDLVNFKNYGKLKSTLGGTGLSVSASSNNKKWAVQFAEWIVSPEIQSSFYAEHSGQPGHRSAWIDTRINSCCNNFFINTLPALERAYMRPRYNGYLYFQEHAGNPLQQYLLHGGNPTDVLESINKIYRTSKQLTSHKANIF
jgi:multiple sugar transport system substrate-binding protein